MRIFFRGRGIKANLKKRVTGFIKSLFPVGSIYNAPRDIISSGQLITGDQSKDSPRIFPVFAEENRMEAPPQIFNYAVSERFKKYYNRNIPSAYIVELPGGMVYGRESNFIITSYRKLLSDVSREFGMDGGKPMDQSSLLKSVLILPAPIHLKGKVAVVTTSGANNFHHWNYDCIPRLYLLKQAGLLDEIVTFIISHNHLPFQKESLRLLGIDESKIINPSQRHTPLFQADVLYIPSLPSALGTVSPWVVNFLRDLYNNSNQTEKKHKKIYLSRKNVRSRKVMNNEEFVSLLNEFDIAEVFPEDHSVSELAGILLEPIFIISIHGSGLSNLCFVSDGTTVVDILAPHHQDGYYWMISNIRNSKYIGFFGEGDHPADDFDLVKNKIDEDIYLDISKMHSLLVRENYHHESI